jgi:hypothetical protein
LGWWLFWWLFKIHLDCTLASFFESAANTARSFALPGQPISVNRLE